MPKWWGCLLVVVLALAPAAVRAGSEPVLPAKAYLLMDATTGEVLHEYQGYQQLPMASTTKIMTAILALERGNLDDVVTAGVNPYNTGGTTIYLEIGEEQTLGALLYALMLESANDAGVAIAEHLAGSEALFAEWMTEKAIELGATGTRFRNSHGLHHPEHYTTAYDLALIARYAMRNPLFRELVATEAVEMPGYGWNGPRLLRNRNQLLGYTEGANGVKNGYTEEAGLTNVASARRGDTELIAVVLGAQNRLWTSSEALLEFGFGQFRTVHAVREGEAVGQRTLGLADLEAVAAESVALTLRAGEGDPVRQIEWAPDLRAPIEAGAAVGRLVITVNGRRAAEVALLAAAPVEAMTFSEFLAARRAPGEFERELFGLIGMVLLGAGAAAGLTLSLNRIRALASTSRRP